MTSFEPPAGRVPGGPEPVFPPPPAHSPASPGLPPPPPVLHMEPARGVARPLGGLATATSVLLGVASLASVGVAIALLGRASLIDRLDLTTSRPTRSELNEIDSADQFVAGMNVVLFLALLSTGIVFIIWQYKYAKNAVVLNNGPLGLGPGWAIGGWFIPFANLVLPFLQLRRSAAASDPEPRRIPGILTAWTIAYIAASLIIFVGIGTRPSDRDTELSVIGAIDKFARADNYMGVGLLIYTAAGVLGIIMVRTLTVRQHMTISARTTPAW